jgi:predicted AlkP superfamily phosphohydrolase/phosphomutase
MRTARNGILLLLLCCQTATLARDRSRVFLMSFDALGYQRLTEDDAAKELTALRRLMKTGAHADGLIAAYPSTTANGHAALWTGTYAGNNGILYNQTPQLPRSGHTFTERVDGFRSEALTAEPIWLAAARQGRSVVAHQVTQAYPFLPQTAGAAPTSGLTIVNGFQSRSFSTWRVVRPGEGGVKESGCAVWEDPRVRGARLCFEWQLGPGAPNATIYAAVLRDRVLVANSPAAASVEVIPHAAESGPPLQRELARFWSRSLNVTNLPDNAPAAVTFRLFVLPSKPADIELLQSPVQETALWSGDSRSARDFVEATGPMVGNGATHSWERGELGTPAYRGGSGEAERKYLETIELVVRQQIAQSKWLFQRYDPDLHITYLSCADDVDHSWYAFDRAGDTRYRQFRRWAYAAINRAADSLLSLASGRDDVVFTSDHGMAPVKFLFSANQALMAAGLHSQAIAYNTCIMLNTSDWKGGIVRPPDRASMLQKVEDALRTVRDTGGRPVVSKVYRTKEEMTYFGHNGPAGADLCFDLIPDYGPSESMKGGILTPADPPRGMHGLDPGRDDMKAMLLISSPRVSSGLTLGTLRSASVAAIVSALLGIEPPKNSTYGPPLSLKLR